MNNVGLRARRSRSSAKLDVPERAKYLRVVTSEIHRICDHLTLVGAMGMELGAMTVFLYAIEARDLIYDRLAELCGARLTSNYAPHRRRRPRHARGLDREDDAVARPHPRAASTRSTALLTRNRIFIDRTRGTGKVSARGRDRARLHGPVPARVGRAVRRPQGGAVPRLRPARLRHPGRLERRQLRPLPDARSRRCGSRTRSSASASRRWSRARSSSQDFRYALPPKPLVYGTIEGLMAHFKLDHGGDQGPRRRGLQLHRGANGELGFYVVSDGGGRPVQARACARRAGRCWRRCPYMLKGSLLADLVPTFDTINMIGGEVEQ